MALQPKKTKFRKAQRGSMKGAETRGTTIAFGEYGLQSLDTAWVTTTQIEAARVALTRHMKRHGKVWIRVFPDKPVTKKPAETRMGKGKGAPETWVAVVRRGRILFEIDGITLPMAQEAMSRAASKLSVRTRFVSRETPA
ncbi:MAG: 50S ribosomal protein L16 [bacterium]|nr:50S ribosomal protein L16 [bacterium]